jgi:hypothetical protein
LQRRGDNQEQRRLESLSDYTFAAGSFPLTELSADITKRLPRYAFLASHGKIQKMGMLGQLMSFKIH